MIQGIDYKNKYIYVSDSGAVFNDKGIEYHKYRFSDKAYVDICGYVCVEDLVKKIGGEG